MPEHVIDLLNEVDADLVWFKDNMDSLKVSYDGMFVAISDRKVVDANRDVEKLLKALKSRNLNPGNMLIQFVSSLPTIY